MSIMVLLTAITITFKVRFRKTETLTSFTAWPYYIICVYLLGKICEHSSILSRGGIHEHQDDPYLNLGVLLLEYLLCSVILIQAMEWTLYAWIIKFQASFDIGDLIVKKEEFRRKEYRIFQGFIYTGISLYLGTVLIGLILTFTSRTVYRGIDKILIVVIVLHGLTSIVAFGILSH